jgi:hypothetical protein
MKPAAVSSLWHWPSLSLDAQIPDVIRHTALRSSDFPLPKRASASAATARRTCITMLVHIAKFVSVERLVGDSEGQLRLGWRGDGERAVGGLRFYRDSVAADWSSRVSRRPVIQIVVSL